MMCAMCVFHRSRFFLGSRAILPGARPNSGVAVTVRWPKCLSWRRAGRRLETTEDLEGSLALGFAGAVALRRGLLRALVGEDGDHATRTARERDALVVHVGCERHAPAANLRGVNGSSRVPRLEQRGRRAGRTTKGCFLAAGG